MLLNSLGIKKIKKTVSFHSLQEFQSAPKEKDVLQPLERTKSFYQFPIDGSKTTDPTPQYKT